MCEELILVSRKRNIGAKFQRDTRQEIIDFSSLTPTLTIYKAP